MTFCLHCIAVCATGQASERVTAKPGSKWRLVADKVRAADGPAEVAALLRGKTISNDKSATTLLPLFVPKAKATVAKVTKKGAKPK